MHLQRGGANEVFCKLPTHAWQVVSAEAMVGYSEQAKCSQIAKVFDDAYKVGPVG